MGGEAVEVDTRPERSQAGEEFVAGHVRERQSRWNLPASLEALAGADGEVVEFVEVAPAIVRFVPDEERRRGEVVPEGATGQERGPEVEAGGKGAAFDLIEVLGPVPGAG